jgi:cell wall-associated NlpC family hydrolase
VDAVLAKAVAYGMGQAGGPAAGLLTGSGAMVAGSGDAVVLAAMRALGTPYVWGGESPGGFDCSGLVQWAYAQTGVRVPRTTREQINVGVAVGLNDLRPGDLVFTRGGRVPTDLGHVAIYAGNGMVIVAPRTGQTVQFRLLAPGSVQAVRRVLLA